jgi:hypothetical protein
VSDSGAIRPAVLPVSFLRRSVAAWGPVGYPTGGAACQSVRQHSSVHNSAGVCLPAAQCTTVAGRNVDCEVHSQGQALVPDFLPRQRACLSYALICSAGRQVSAPSVFEEASKALSIIVPAYNEEDRLGATLEETLK